MYLKMAYVALSTDDNEKVKNMKVYSIILQSWGGKSEIRLLAVTVPLSGKLG